MVQRRGRVEELDCIILSRQKHKPCVSTTITFLLIAPRTPKYRNSSVHPSTQEPHRIFVCRANSK